MSKKSKKKKKQKKNYHFATQSPAPHATEKNLVEKKEPKPNNAVKTTTVDDDFLTKLAFMKKDARLSALIMGTLILCLVILWVIFEHTGVGPKIYDLVRF